MPGEPWRHEKGLLLRQQRMFLEHHIFLLFSAVAIYVHFWTGLLKSHVIYRTILSDITFCLKTFSRCVHYLSIHEVASDYSVSEKRDGFLQLTQSCRARSLKAADVKVSRWIRPSGNSDYFRSSQPPSQYASPSYRLLYCLLCQLNSPTDITTKKFFAYSWCSPSLPNDQPNMALELSLQ
jgi:hypothetical protein